MNGRTRAPQRHIEPCRRNRGQSLVEFALVVPLFILMLFGLIDLGRYVYATNAMNQATREAARVGSVQGWAQDCGGASSRTVCIQNTTNGRMVGVPTTTVSSSCSRTVGTGPITVTADNCQPGDVLSVQASTSFSMLTPVIGQMLGTVTVHGQAQITVNS